MSVLPATISRLRAVRKSKGIVLQQLSVLADVSVTTLVAMEKYGHLATPETYQKLANTLGVSVPEIIGWETVPDPDEPSLVQPQEAC